MGPVGSFLYEVMVRSNTKEEDWFKIHGDSLAVENILPQQVAISEAYILVYEKSEIKA